MEEQLHQIRNKLIDRVALGCIIYIIPALIASILRFTQIGWHWIYLFHFLLALAVSIVFIFRSKLSVNFKTHFICVVFLVLSFMGTLNFGISGAYFYCMLSVILGTLIFGKRAGYIYFFISIIGLSIIGILHVSKIIHPGIDFNIYNSNFTTWISLFFGLLFLMIIFIYGIGLFYYFFNLNISALIEKTKEQEIVQTELKKSEEKFRAIFENAIDAIFLMKNGFFVECNSTTLEMFHCKKENIIGRTPIEFSPEFQPDGRKSTDKASEKIQMALNGFPQFFEWKHLKYNNELFDAEVSLNKVIVNNENYLLAIVRDVTKRKMAEAKLEQQSNELAHAYQLQQMLFDQTFQFIGQLKPDGTVIRANQTALNFAGISEEEIVGRLFWETPWWQHDTTQQQLVKESIKRAATGEMVRFETTHTDKVGNTHNVDFSLKPMCDANGKIVCLIPEGRDITDRKLAEEALRENEERFKTLSSMASEGLMIHEAGIILDLNPAFANLIGYSSPDDLIGKNSFEVIPFTPESRQTVLYHSRSNSHDTYDIEIINPAGKITPMETRGAEIVYKGNKARLVYMHDITDRKQAVQKIRESEERFRLILENMPILLNAFDENDNVIIWNKACEEVTGYKADEIIGNPAAMELLYPDPNYRLKVWNSSLDPMNNNNVYNLVTKKGEIRTIEWFDIYHHLTIPGWASWGMGLDITQRTRVEEALKESEERYRELSDLLPQAVFETDLNGKLIYVNQIAYNLFHYSYADFNNGLSAFDMLIPEDRENTRKRFKTLLFENHSLAGEYTALRKNGSTFPIILFTNTITRNYQPVGIRGLIFDITERKLAEKELEKYREHLEQLVKDRTKELEKAKELAEESEKMFKAITNQSTEGICLTDMDGNYIFVNPAFCKMTRFTEEELLKMTVFDLRGMTQTPVFNDSITIKQGVPIPVILKRKDAIEFFTEIIGNVVNINNQNFVLGTIRDITERKQSENELLLARDAAETANRAKSEFLSNMSHELRTPLNAILGFSKLLRFQNNITEIQKEQLLTVYQCGEHLLSLINDILDMSKIEAQKLELTTSEVNLPEILQTIFKINKVKADEKDLSYLLEKKASLPAYVLGDERKLKQIMLNLINNAIKFTEEGTITIRVDYIDVENLFIFEVIDTGVGIPVEKQLEIFEPFIQHPGKKLIAEGTGLGLSITKKLVEMMDGKISLNSEPGKGSIFRVEIPLKIIVNGKRTGQDEYNEITGYKGTRKLILVIDDNQSNVSYLVSMLGTIGFITETAENGLIALQKLKKLKPDLILLDYRMPVMDGLEFIRKIRKEGLCLDIKIIGVSATVYQKDLKQEFHDMCDGFVPKPIDTNLLFESLKEILNIEWILDEKAREKDDFTKMEDLKFPPESINLQIIEFSEIGDFNSINQILDNLLNKNLEYENFCKTIRKYVKNYDKDSILKVFHKIQ